MDEYRTATRTAIITGGARGMGRACAERLAASGAAAGLIDLDRRAGEEAAGAIASLGHIAVFAQADVTSRSEVEDAVARLTAELGRVSVLVNAAGILRETRFAEISESEWDAVVGVSLKGAFLCSQACLPMMVAQHWGRIVNFSSTAGKSVSTLGGAHYTAAKAGVLGLTRALAKEVASLGVCVNAVCPGLIETPMVRELSSEDELARWAMGFPIPRLGTSEEVAALVGFLCSDEAAYITGAAIDINGGDLMV